MTGISRNHKLYRPRDAVVVRRHKHNGDLRKLSDEHLSHLRVQVRFRLFDKHQMEAGGLLCCLVRLKELQQLEEDKNEIACTQAVIGFGQSHSIRSRISN